MAFVVGAGVSAAASGGSDVALWRGLLRNGIQRCFENDVGLGQEFVARQHAQIDGTMIEMLYAGDVLADTLEEQGDFGSWLAETVGSLPIENAALLDAFARFDRKLMIATTNYDTLLESKTGREGVSMGEPDALGVLRGDRNAVLHVHGHWRDPRSVVLGMRSYRDLLADKNRIARQQLLVQLKTLVFVGFGKGLHDPNFAPLVRWVADALEDSPYYHYQLVLDADVEAERALLPRNSRIRVVGYGSSHDDLPGFLESLTTRAQQPSQSKPVTAAQPLTPSVTLPPREVVSEDGANFEQFIGREATLETFAGALDAMVARARNEDATVATAPRVIWLHGFGGMGKSTFVRRAWIEVHRRYPGAVEIALVDWKPGSRWISPVTGPLTSAQLFDPIAERIAQQYDEPVMDLYWAAHADVQRCLDQHRELDRRFRDAVSWLELLGLEWRTASSPAGLSDEMQSALRNDTVRRDISALEQTLRQLQDDERFFADTAGLRRYICAIKQSPERESDTMHAWALTLLGPGATAALVTPERVLAEALSASIYVACSIRPLVLAMDTYEQLGSELDRAVRRIVTRAHEIDAPFMALIASRSKPDASKPLGSRDTWTSRIDGAHLRLEPFDETRVFNADEIRRMLALRDVAGSALDELVDLVQKVTLGVPLAVRLLLDRSDGCRELHAELVRLNDAQSDSTDVPQAVRKAIEAVSQSLLGSMQSNAELADDFAALIAIAVMRVPNLELLGRLWGMDNPEERLRWLARQSALFRGEEELHETVRAFVRMQWRAKRPPELAGIVRRMRELYADMRPPEGDAVAFAAWLVEDLNLLLWEWPRLGIELFPARAAVLLAYNADTDGLRSLLDELLATPGVARRRLTPLQRIVPPVNRGSTAVRSRLSHEDVAWVEAAVSDRWSALERASTNIVAGMSLFDPKQKNARAHAPVRNRLSAAIEYFGARLPRASQVVRAYAYTVLMTATSSNRVAEHAVELLTDAGLLGELEQHIRALALYSRNVVASTLLWKAAMSADGSGDDYHTLGHIFGDAQDERYYRAAGNAFRQAAEREPEAQRHYACWAAHTYRHDPKRAKELAERAISAGTVVGEPEGLNNLAWIMYEKQADLAAAERYARAAYRSSLDDMQVLHTLVAIEVLRGNWADGAKDLRLMLESERPSGPTLRWDSIHQVVADALQAHGVETIEILRTLANAADWEDMTLAAEALITGDAAFAATASEAMRRHFDGLKRAIRPAPRPRGKSAARRGEVRAPARSSRTSTRSKERVRQ